MHPKEPKDPKDWDHPKRPCISPSHNFPGMLVIPTGRSHTHTCPVCGETTTVTSPIVICNERNNCG